MHATMSTKQRLWIFKFCSLSDFSEKKLGTFQIGRVLTFIHTVCICLVMPGNCNYGYSRAVTQGFHVFIRKKVVKLLVQEKNGRIPYHANCVGFYQLATVHNDTMSVDRASPRSCAFEKSIDNDVLIQNSL